MNWEVIKHDWVLSTVNIIVFVIIKHVVMDSVTTHTIRIHYTYYSEYSWKPGR